MHTADHYHDLPVCGENHDYAEYVACICGVVTLTFVRAYTSTWIIEAQPMAELRGS